MKAFVSVMLCLCVLILPTVSGFALSGHVPADVAQLSKEVAVETEKEGIVLLKNDDDCLPLEGKKLNVFGAGSVCPFLGGAGSGAITTDDPVTFYEALDEYGIEYNKTLQKLYEKSCSSNDPPKTDSTVFNNLFQLILAKSSLDEMPVSKLTDKVMNEAKAFSDTALIMISRTSAEGSDISEDILRLNGDEKQLVEKVTSAFENVIVLFNIGNIMEMDWINEYDSIKAAAIIWIPGEFGMLSAAQMLRGDFSPSGKLADTVAHKVSDHPSGECFGSHKYDNGDAYVEYLEGIYVGYRYFETFAPEKVLYPFGYGLSYTSFEKEIADYSTDGDISVSVKVTNTGDKAGKDTVQIYYSAPYIRGGIEKAACVLGGFGKTKELAPGESETVTVSFPVSDMASYDSREAQGWVLDAGEYEIYLGENVREKIDGFSYNQQEKEIIKTDSATGKEIKNLFTEAYDGFTVLSRNDPEGTYPVCRELKADEKVKKSDKVPGPTEGEAPKMGVKHSGGVITLKDVYENGELMEDFLDQLSLDEMATLVTHSGYETQAIKRLGIPKTFDNDGPSAVKGRNGILYVDCGTAYPCETAIACTWNCELAEKLGESVGTEADAIGTDIWYAPGANIHRNPRGGRNFEYFSEDPLVSGIMASSIITGAKEKGLVSTIKHFALNDQESHRNGIYTWAEEQAMREIYLKAFEIPVKSGSCDGIMSAYNRVGANWCGGSSALLKDLLREEWGFDGFVVSDYSTNFLGTGYMSPVLAVYNGNDTMLSGVWLIQGLPYKAAVKTAYYKDPAGFGNAMRDACRNICKMKMKTKAFLEPDDYDASLFGALEKPSEWNFEFPYVFSLLRYILNNFVNVILWAARVIF